MIERSPSLTSHHSSVLPEHGPQDFSDLFLRHSSKHMNSGPLPSVTEGTGVSYLISGVLFPRASFIINGM